GIRDRTVTGVQTCALPISGRSIPTFHLLEALEQMPDLFSKFGGHYHAAGLTMASGRVEEFRGKLNAYAATRLTAADFIPTLMVDATVTLDEITAHAAEEAR